MFKNELEKALQYEFDTLLKGGGLTMVNRTNERFMITLPSYLRELVKSEARKNDRTVSQEINYILKRYYKSEAE